MKNLPRHIAAFAVGSVLMVTAIALVFNARAEDHSGAKSKSVVLNVDDRPLPRDVKMATSFAPIVKTVAPSVVRVDITIAAKEQTVPQSFNFGPDNPLFRQFFGNLPQFQQKWESPAQQGVGSGVIVSKDGYILTNNHVVDDADKVTVTLNDGREFTAKVIGKDPQSDLAVIKIDAKDLPAIALADSGQVEVGDLVLAVGNPFGIGQTVTMGIVSAKDRATMDLNYQDFIQTDAPINPGNSGGALVDAEGRLIGVNTAIYSRSGGNQGIGFAIPTDLARSVMISLIDYGKVTRGYLGVAIQDINPQLAGQFELKDNKGALVTDVAPDGPADKAGLKSGDVIVKFNGKPVVDTHLLQIDVANAEPGQTVPVEIIRDGSIKTVDVKVKSKPGEKEVAQADQSTDSNSDTLHGVAVGNVDPQAREQFNIPSRVHGAIVTEVDPSSVAAQSGLKPGDVIEEINHHAVASADDAVKLTEHAKERITLLRIWSGQGSHYLVVDETNKAG